MPRIFSRKSKERPIAERLILAGFRRYFILCADLFFVNSIRIVRIHSRHRNNRHYGNRSHNRSRSPIYKNTVPRRARKRKETWFHLISISSFFIL
ncbi:MAG TPA: hypothetical protein PKD52_05200 [Clostridiales bacterium]|nr:hypothetical protein [Clostridiales bacterium]